MHRNFIVCPHCTAKGLPGTVWTLGSRTPTVNLSDGKSFHLVLFSGPDSVPAPSGGILGNRLAAQFSYVHDPLGSSSRRLAVMLTRPSEKREGVTKQLEEVCLRLATVLVEGKPLHEEYGFDGEQLWEIEDDEKRN